MTAKLLRKELRLALVPPAVLFLLTAFMMLIPSYPLLVIFFYGLLGIFFICVFGRENHDVEYTALLPVTRTDIVRARFILCIGLELILAALSAVLAALRPALGMHGNDAGMDPGPAFFGIGLLLMGLFNLIFFPMYYKNTNKVGVPFTLGSIVYALGVIAAEAASFVTGIDDAAPIVGITILVSGAASYAVMTWAAYKTSVRRFRLVGLTS